MSEVRHTPGEWRLVPNGYEGGREEPFYWGVQAGDGALNPNTQDGFNMTAWMNGADARLIAAAPDLLAALKAAVECGIVPVSSAKDGGANAGVTQVRVADQIRAAIAKAKGG